MWRKRREKERKKKKEGEEEEAAYVYESICVEYNTIPSSLLACLLACLLGGIERKETKWMEWNGERSIARLG